MVDGVKVEVIVPEGKKGGDTMTYKVPKKSKKDKKNKKPANEIEGVIHMD